MEHKETTFGVIVGTRGFFNTQLALEGRAQLLKKLEAMGYRYVITPIEATPKGCIETVADAAVCAKLFSENRDKIDGVIVSLPNFGDELGIVETLARAKLNVPVLVQASDDEIDKVDVDHRRDSFCGKLSVCNNLYQYGIPFTDTTYHTCKIESEEFSRDIERFAAICRVVRGLRSMRVGAIGARPAPFQTMRISEKLLQAYGITVVTVDLSEIIAAAQAVHDSSKELQAKLEELRSYGRIPADIKRENLIRQAKLSLALERWMDDNDIQAAGFQCWTSIQINYGCGACVSMSMLSEKLRPVCCEVDVGGAISMYALTLATRKPSALLDWNNNYGDDREMCVNTHCSSYPKSFFGGEVEISNQDVLGKSLGPDRCFGAVKGKVRAGPMTFFRISTDDRKGRIRSYVGEGEFTDDRFDMQGGIAVCRVAGLQRLMKYLCANGFEHHVAMVRTHCADVLEEAVGKYIGWDVYRHV